MRPQKRNEEMDGKRIAKMFALAISYENWENLVHLVDGQENGCTMHAMQPFQFLTCSLSLSLDPHIHTHIVCMFTHESLSNQFNHRDNYQLIESGHQNWHLAIHNKQQHAPFLFPWVVKRQLDGIGDFIRFFYHSVLCYHFGQIVHCFLLRSFGQQIFHGVMKSRLLLAYSLLLIK